MGLSKYREKRSEEKTPEPFGGKTSGTELRFCSKTPCFTFTLRFSP